MPYLARVSSAAAWSSAFSDTSALTEATSALVRFRPSTAEASAASSISQSMTFQSSACASAVAMPSPMPDAAPVTNAIFPSGLFNGFSYASFWLPSYSPRLRHCSTFDNGIEELSVLGGTTPASWMRTQRCNCWVIQGNPPFAGPPPTLPGVLDAGKGPDFLRPEIVSPGPISSSRATSLFASSSRPASAQLATRYAMPTGCPATLAMPSLPI